MNTTYLWRATDQYDRAYDEGAALRVAANLRHTDYTIWSRAWELRRQAVIHMLIVIEHNLDYDLARMADRTRGI